MLEGFVAPSMKEECMEVVFMAVSRLCARTDAKPDSDLMNRAFHLYTDGNDTPDKLVDALRRFKTH